MKCTNCGTELFDNASFCTNCGTPCRHKAVQSSLAAEPIAEETHTPKKKRKGLIPVILILLVLAAALAAVYFFFHFFQGGSCDEPEVCVICGKEQDADIRHKWSKATCEEPQTCSICGKTKGDVKEHDWAAATCESPEVCTVCGETQGDALEHRWSDATCTDPAVCEFCGQTQGTALEHDWIDATCTEPAVCSFCGQTQGTALDHDWVDATDTAPKTCSRCHATSGLSLGVPLTACTIIDESQSASGNDIVDGTLRDFSGNYHDNSVVFWVNKASPYTNVEHRVYRLSGAYAVLRGTITLGIDSHADAGIRFYFYDGDTLLYTSDYVTGTEETSFEIDISGVYELRIVCETQEYCHSYGLLDATLHIG